MLLIGRAAAKAAGLLRYFTGKPCKHGHKVERQTANGCCVECSAARYTAWRSKHPEKSRAASVAWAAANPDRAKSNTAAWRAKNQARIQEYNAETYAADPAKAKAAAKAWRIAHLAQAKAARVARYAADPKRENARSAAWKTGNPERVKEGWKNWYAAHPAESRARGRNRKAAKLHATPCWADTEAMLAYDRAADRLTLARGISYHVDHIVPLQGRWIEFEPGVRCREVCGLNYEGNLQVLLGSENIRKKNKLSQTEATKPYTPPPETYEYRKAA